MNPKARNGKAGRLLPAAPCSASPHPTGNHVARVVEYHRNGGVWIHATCVACNREWKERYRFDFAYETVTPNDPGSPTGRQTT